MARKLDAMPPQRKLGRRLYPWHQWLDGSPWELTRGVDFVVSVQAMRGCAYQAASRRRVGLTAVVMGDDVLVVRALR